MVMMSGVSTEAIYDYYITPELCGIVLWTEGNRADYIHFIIKKDLMLQLQSTMLGIQSPVKPQCVCYIGPVFSLEVSSIS